jgi:hypothetical protein
MSPRRTSRSPSTPPSRCGARSSSRASRHRQDRPGSRDRQGGNAPLIEWHVKSTTKAHQGLYEYDAVARLRDGQLGDPRVHDISNYIRKGKLWEAFTSPQLPVLLIDEIDKADIEFPNDLLRSSIAWSSTSTKRARR